MGLTEVPVDSVEKIMQIITDALLIRTSGKTGANDTSSRSHAILQMELKYKRYSGNNSTYSRMSFIDLAGSERGADTINQDK
jgi:kinesin family protein 2/24